MIDPLASATGWSASGSGRAGIDPVINPVNTYPDYCAGLQTSSLTFTFYSANPGAYVQKTLTPIDVSAYEEIVLSVLSVRANGIRFEQTTDFMYQIDFGDGRLYLIPTWGTFTHVTIPIAFFGTVTISRIRITYLGSLQDYFVASYMVANFQDLPVDIMNGVQAGIQSAFAAQFGLGIKIGTVTGSAGDTKITMTGSYAFMDRYSVLLISDGVNSETHAIIDVDGPVGQLGSTFDGATLLYPHVNAQVYVTIPAQIGRSEQAPPLPGVIIWCQDPDPVLIGTDYDSEPGCWCTAGSAYNGPAMIQEGRTERWKVQLDAAAVQGQAMAAAGTVIRTWLSKHVIWVNGAKLEFIWTDRPGSEEASDVVELIPKTHYTVDIEMREDVWLPMPTPPAVAGTSGQLVTVQEVLALP